MLDEYTISIYNADRTTKLLDTCGDIRNIDKTLSVDGMEIEIVYAAFIPKIFGVNNTHYIHFIGYDSNTYRIIKVIPHTDYLELYLSECEVISIE